MERTQLTHNNWNFNTNTNKPQQEHSIECSGNPVEARLTKYGSKSVCDFDWCCLSLFHQWVVCICVMSISWTVFGWHSAQLHMIPIPIVRNGFGRLDQYGKWNQYLKNVIGFWWPTDRPIDWVYPTKCQTKRKAWKTMPLSICINKLSAK